MSDIPKDHLEKIKNDLTSVSKDYITDEIVKVSYYWLDEETGYIQIPRFYPITFSSINDITNVGAALQSDFKMNEEFSYRDGQEVSVKESLSENILTLMKPPGSGKTIIGACAIHDRGVRSLILVDQDNLKTQWVDALKLIFKDTIKINRNLKLDGSVKDIGCDVYVTTIQGVIAKIRKNGLAAVRELYQSYNIGHVILDECHVLIGPEKFSLFGHICNSKYILAMSATPKDDIYFQYWLGTIIVGDNDYEVTPYICQLEYSSQLHKKKKYINWGGKYRRDRYAQALYKQDQYLNYICSIAYKAYLLKRQILLICNYNKYGVNNVVEYIIKKYNLSSDLVATYISGCKKDEESVKPIIVGNYKMLQKGTDIPTLDTLIMADSVTNRTALEQVIGRLLRLNKGVIKKSLLVMDITDCDYGELFWRHRKIRSEFYEEKNFYII